MVLGAAIHGVGKCSWVRDRNLPDRSRRGITLSSRVYRGKTKHCPFQETVSSP